MKAIYTCVDRSPPLPFAGADYCRMGCEESAVGRGRKPCESGWVDTGREGDINSGISIPRVTDILLGAGHEV